ncbi:oligosaccharyltransferase complex subunit epsilon, partial [Spiromyces aspiralis]
MASSTFGEALGVTIRNYVNDTPANLKLIDAYLAYCVATGLLQVLYATLVGTHPYNAFVAGFGSAVGSFVLAANLRIKLNPKNAGQFLGRPEGAFAEF